MTSSLQRAGRNLWRKVRAFRFGQSSAESLPSIGLLKSIGLVACAVLSAGAQTQAPPPNPNVVVLAGGAFRGGSLGAWADYCKKTTEKIYACAAVDLWGSHASTRGGVETIFLQRPIFALPVTVTLKGDAGAAASPFGIGGSYGAGLSGVADVGKWTKVAGTYFAASVSIIKENVNVKTSVPGIVKSARENLVVRVGIGKSF